MNKNAKYVIWGLVAVAVVALLVLMFRPAGGGAQVENVSADRAAELIASGVKVLDVRTAGEFQAGRLPGAINIPVDQVPAQLASLDPAEPILVYCATGSRSASTVDYLTQAGFAKIYHYDQGMVTWAGEVERGTAVAAAEPVVEAPQDSPVLYEFFTDW